MSDHPIRVVRQPGGAILAVSLVLSVLISLAADFNETHLFNPAWPPHAVFHDAAMLHLLTGMGLLGLWLIGRPTREPEVAAFVAWAIPMIFWSPFFWVTLVLPNASLQAIPGPPPQIAGVTVLPNVVAAGILILLASFGYRRFRRAGIQS